MFAPLTTVINTFGGQWYNMDWQAQVNSPAYKDAVKFYIDTLAASGEGDPVSFGFTECLNLFSQERAAMWYDATSAAGSVEDPKNSKVAGKVGYVRAPVKMTENSGWLWSWNLGINAESKNKDAAWEFVKWATSKDYAKLVGSQLGWSRTPPGTRKSTYLIPEYIQAGGDFAPLTAKIMNEVDPKQAGRRSAAVGRHPVRDDPGVPRCREPDLPAARRRDRRPKTTRSRPRPGAEDRPARRRQPEEGLR